MKKRQRIMYRSQFVLVIFYLASCASSRSAVERDIRAQYDRLERAFAAKDVAVILGIRDPAFEAIGPQGQRDDYEHMAGYTRQWFVTNELPIEVHFTLQSIEIRSPDEAAVRVIQRASRYQQRDGKRVRVEPR